MNAPYDAYDYQVYWKNRDYEDQSERIALNYFFKKIGDKSSILDVGGGYGRLVDSYVDRFDQCTILDPSQKLLDEGKEKFKLKKNINFMKGSLPNLPFSDESMDICLLVRVAHHLADPLPSIMEIKRVLKKNGFLILEVANKIHFMARVKSFLSGDFSFADNFNPVEKRSPESIKEDKITFMNHHPKKIINDLKENGFSIKEILSVSNFRNQVIKKIIPMNVLLFKEKIMQKPFGNLFFGPSIFLLAEKL